MMMIPEAWEETQSMSDEKRAFYEYHACMMEPWDGPASIAFTDGSVVGAVLDRNGLRPSRYCDQGRRRRDGDRSRRSSDIAPEDVVQKSRLQPGRMFLVDTAQGGSSPTKRSRAVSRRASRIASGCDENMVRLEDLPEPDASVCRRARPRHAAQRQRVLGYTREDLR